jgi:transposase-like protein
MAEHLGADPSPAVMASIALEAIRADKSLAELARIHGVQIEQILGWKIQLLKHASEVFQTEAAAPRVPTIHDFCDPREFDNCYFGLC